MPVFMFLLVLGIPTGALVGYELHDDKPAIVQQHTPNNIHMIKDTNE